MTDPSLEAAVADAASTEGWGFFEHHADPKKGEAAKSAATARGEKAAATLARLQALDPDFADALDFLLDSTLRRQTFTAALGLDPMQAYAFGVFREGQNSFAFAMLKLIALGRKQEAPKGRDL